jgi:hypothetical protein
MKMPTNTTTNNISTFVAGVVEMKKQQNRLAMCPKYAKLNVTKIPPSLQ